MSSSIKMECGSLFPKNDFKFNGSGQVFCYWTAKESEPEEIIIIKKGKSKMENCVLFSAVGGTDPISNGHDGGILHICRIYRPEKIYLYMSSDIIYLHEKDNRYCYCLHQLMKLTGFQAEIILIKRENLTDVHKFDNFYLDFENTLDDIGKENPGKKILLNISSGTPAMKSALTVIQILGKRDTLAIQVAHPNHQISYQIEDRREYLPELQWECNRDNQENFENRSSIYRGEKLLSRIKKEIIVKHLEAYDYTAALRIAEEISNDMNGECLKMLECAVYRFQQNKSRIDKQDMQISQKLFPVNGSERLIFEYALWLQATLKRLDYVNFARGITPLVMDIYEMYLKTVCKIDLKNKYYRKTVKNGIEIYKFQRSKLEQDEKGQRILHALNDKYQAGYNFNGPVYSEALQAIIEEFSGDEEVLRAMEIIHGIETNVRNIAAHEIVAIDEAWIKKHGGCTTEQLMKAIRFMVEKTCKSVKGSYWVSYDQMNEMIIKLL